jgi:Cu-Zn family superoxide dismutase
MIQIFIIMVIILFFNIFYKKINQNKDDKNNKQIKAIAYFGSDIPSLNKQVITGKVLFSENLINNTIKIDIDLNGLKPNHKHGFHIHEAGDLSDKCESMCAHFNPFNKNHGGPNSLERHVGDLGNIQADSKGKAKYSFEDNLIKLRGKCNIIGRGLIIHEDTDDLGLGNNKASLITGNAGKRIACAVIGYSKNNFIK